MRAADRCKAVREGDKCRKARGHDSMVAMNPDPEHEGANCKWVDGSDKTKEKFPMDRAKELKGVNRMLKSFVEADELGRTRFMKAGPGENGLRTVFNFVRKGAK